MAHGGQHTIEHAVRLEIEEKVKALHKVPGGHAVTQQHQ